MSAAAITSSPKTSPRGGASLSPYHREFPGKLVSLHHPEGREVLTEAMVKEVNLRTAVHAGEKVFSSRKLAAPHRELDRPRDWEWWQPVTGALVPTGLEPPDTAEDGAPQAGGGD
jgi:hypothetical protein